MRYFYLFGVYFTFCPLAHCVRTEMISRRQCANLWSLALQNGVAGFLFLQNCSESSNYRCFLSFLPRLSAKSHFTLNKNLSGCTLRDGIASVFAENASKAFTENIVLLNNFPLVYEKSNVSDFLPLRLVFCTLHNFWHNDNLYLFPQVMEIYFFL